MPKIQIQPLLVLHLMIIAQLWSSEFPIMCDGFSVSGLSSVRTTSDLEEMGRVCKGKMGECSTEMEEGMDSESNRRMLVMQKNYISYGTLKRDMVPCSTPGSSYYNCRAQANPYNRGCEVITGCARSISDIKS
ncbi:protein RALF-like 24 [Impatiens glandulifera]|uniref:protein RALF-like 24 n=1 Tax=Impatiens glandulifera TaxID=253017 RepID=UPI001FB1160F|nr:protein RALF-like 24 [Impatiens glandulifera]